MPTNQIIEIDRSNSIRPIYPEEENLPTIEKVSISPEEKQNDEIMIGFVGIENVNMNMLIILILIITNFKWFLIKMLELFLNKRKP